jgi:hypothetical protein
VASHARCSTILMLIPAAAIIRFRIPLSLGRHLGQYLVAFEEHIIYLELDISPLIRARLPIIDDQPRKQFNG